MSAPRDDAWLMGRGPVLMRGSDGACWQKRKVTLRRFGSLPVGVVDGFTADLVAAEGRVAVVGMGLARMN